MRARVKEREFLFFFTNSSVEHRACNQRHNHHHLHWGRITRRTDQNHYRIDTMFARLAGKALHTPLSVTQRGTRQLGALTFKKFDSTTEREKSATEEESSTTAHIPDAPPQRLWLNVHPGISKQEWILPAEKANSIHHLDELLEDVETIQAMNRNARRPKKANKGSRPCSRAGRRKRKEKIGKRRRSY